MEDIVCLDKESEPPAEDTEPPSISARVRTLQGFSSPRLLISLPSPAVPGVKRIGTIGRAGKPKRSKFTISSRSEAFLNKVFPEASVDEWNDWRWQLRNRFRSAESVWRIINPSRDEIDALTVKNRSLPLSITPYFASLLESDDPLQPIRREVVPVAHEYSHGIGESEDPLNEEDDSPVPGIVHRYPDRVLFLVTGFCSTYCRYCTRSRMVGNQKGSHVHRNQWEAGIRYIEGNPAIRDVLLSGGDPLTLSDDSLDWLLSRLRRIPHVEFLRIGTKAPVVLPQRITPALTGILRKYHPLWMSIHFTHPDELTPETQQACNRLADAGIPLGSQTVLLSGVNDDVDTMKRLFHGLLRVRVKPYYLYQCDPIPGSSHFRTPVEKGLEIIRGLRGHTTGYAVPTYVIDAPGGGGKIPLLPEYVVGRDAEGLALSNYEGKTFHYPDWSSKH